MKMKQKKFGEENSRLLNNLCDSGKILKGIKLVFFTCFVALRPKSTAMVMAGQSVHLATLFPGPAWISS